MKNARPTSPLARLVTIPAADGLQLPALSFEPSTPTKRLMIWLHGMGPSGIFYNVDHTNALADAFTSSGTAFLGLQNRGGGMLQSIRYYDKSGAKQKRLQGTTHELIAECVQDIDGAIAWAAAQGYSELYLGGLSTGANKTALYHYLRPENPFRGYVLYGGGDDTGDMYRILGPDRFHAALVEARTQVAAGHGENLAPYELMGDHFSYQSAADILDPDGNYNTFPFYEAQHGQLGVKPLWREYKSNTKPTLVVYGEQDEYALPNTAATMQILRDQCPDPAKYTFALISGGDHGCFRHEPELAKTVADWVVKAAEARS
jgi:pimeloyl-ACP methyl ester carboxylesterase